VPLKTNHDVEAEEVVEADVVAHVAINLIDAPPTEGNSAAS
jgi:hypothetical protein